MEPELTADELYKAAQTVLVDEPDWGHRAVATAQLRKALWAAEQWFRDWGEKSNDQSTVTAGAVLFAEALDELGIAPWEAPDGS
mgnify:FL=1